MCVPLGGDWSSIHYIWSIWSWSYLNQHSASWLLILLHVLVRKYFHTILLECLRFLWCMTLFLSIKLFWYVLHLNLCILCWCITSLLFGMKVLWTYQHFDYWQSSWLPQFYGRGRQCGCPFGAQCLMGLGRNPLTNGLIQHTLNFLFVGKFPVTPFD